MLAPCGLLSIFFLGLVHGINVRISTTTVLTGTAAQNSVHNGPTPAPQSSNSSTFSLSGAESSGTVKASIGDFKYSGCYTEAKWNRALTGNTTVEDGMTPETCAAFCNGHRIFGVEYGRECFCGDSLQAGCVKTLEDDCKMPCWGNSSEVCGGEARLSLYSLPGTQLSSSITSGTLSGPSTVTELAGYTYLGCYAEPACQRALPYERVTPWMSVEVCQNLCDGYRYFGVEFSNQCFCGNAINVESLLARGSTPAKTQCNMVCAGNPLEYCGGRRRLNIYKRTVGELTPNADTSRGPATDVQATVVNEVGDYISLGCYTEPSKAQALDSAMIAGDDMTLEKCATFCSDSSYKYMAIEYGRECYCGNSITPGSAKTPGGCTTPCKGNSTQLCGGPSWLQMYYLFTALISPSDTGTSIPSTDTQSARAGFVSSHAAYCFDGCYPEPTGTRALAQLVDSSKAMTVESCLESCDGYKYAGIEFGEECWCGDTLNSEPNPGAPNSTGAQQSPSPTPLYPSQGSSNYKNIQPVDGSDCWMTCSGNEYELCGAGNRLVLYISTPSDGRAERHAFVPEDHWHNREQTVGPATITSTATLLTTVTKNPQRYSWTGRAHSSTASSAADKPTFGFKKRSSTSIVGHHKESQSVAKHSLTPSSSSKIATTTSPTFIDLSVSSERSSLSAKSTSPSPVLPVVRFKNPLLLPSLVTMYLPTPKFTKTDTQTKTKGTS